MAEQSVIGVYGDLAQAEEAVRRLDRGGFPIKQVSIVGQNTEHERDVQGYMTVEDVAKKGVGTGALGDCSWLAHWRRRFWNFWAVLGAP